MGGFWDPKRKKGFILHFLKMEVDPQKEIQHGLLKAKGKLEAGLSVNS
jgi:hypothetical protein